MTTTPGDDRRRGSKGLVLLVGTIALVGLYVAGAVVVGPEIEDDLGARVPAALAAAGFDVTAGFSGQDGTLRCTSPLADPGAARRLALDVYGVRAIELDPSCGVEGDPLTPASSTTAATNTTAPATSTTTTTAATTTTTTEAATTTTVAPAALLAVQLLDGRLVLTGALGTDLERLTLVERARSVVDPLNVVDQLLADPALPAVPADRFAAFNDLMAAMASSLTAGSVEWTGTTITAAGSYVDDRARATFESAATAVGVTPTLTPRPTATAEQAAALEAELNALVAAEPILFDRGSTVISVASESTIERVAGIAKRYAGVRIVVQGHTDSEGDPGRNLTLSSQRATSVVGALVALGVPLAELTSEGFGMTQLIVDADGNEIPEKSRRVVFGVGVGVA